MPAKSQAVANRLQVPDSPRKSVPTFASIHDLTFSALEKEIAASGLPAIHARAFWRALHREAATTFADRADFDRAFFGELR